MDGESPYMTRTEASKYLRVSVDTIDRRIVAKKWRYDLDGGRVLIYREDVVNSVRPGNAEKPANTEVPPNVVKMEGAA